MTLKATLPPGLTKDRFNQALAEYRAALGDDRVIVDLERLVSYNKIMMPVDEALHQPSGVLVATTVEEVQKALAICNRYRIPVWPISTGRNFGYGSAAPATAGQMVLDLRRMNRILEVDGEMGTALVEPGVTNQQLQDYLDEHQLPFWLSFPGPGPIVGPVGNTLDRGVGNNRYGEHAAHFCGMEVVLADGQVLRTGMGGVQGSRTWQSYRWGYGPWLDGLFCQSNFGVVTKMGFWLMAKPETNLMVVTAFRDETAFGNAVDAARKLRLQGVIENCIGGKTLYGITMFARRRDIYQGPGAMPESVLAEIGPKFGAPPYFLASTLYGSAERVAADLAQVRRAYRDLGQTVTSEELGDKLPPPLRHFHESMTGRMSLEEFGVYNFRGGGGSVWFSPIVQVRGSEVLKSMRLCAEVYSEFGFDYSGGFQMGYSGRHFDHITELLFDRTNPEETQRAYACFKKLIEVNAANGFAPYRVNTAFMKQVAEVYGPAQHAVNLRLKRALDPNGILAPGKSGITLT